MNIKNTILKKISELFNNKQNKIQLGRWNLVYCNKKLEHKIFLTNEDHCGPCGQYKLINTNIENNKEK